MDIYLNNTSDNESNSHDNLYSRNLLVSVWMITYNHEKYIKNALDSVLNQKTTFNFEIVIGDDHSSDKTAEILSDYQKKYPELIILILQTRNIGMVPNQNATFKACRGEYIAMLEGDDFWTDTNKLQTQVDAMKSNPTCDLSFHPVTETKYGSILSKHSNKNKIMPIGHVIRGGGYYCPTASLMLKRNVVEQLPEFLNDAPAGDYYLQILGSLNGGALYINKVMATYRIEADGSWSNSVKTYTTKENFRRSTITTLDLLNSHLNYKFDNEIKKRQFSIILTMGYGHLLQNDHRKFQKSLLDAKAIRRSFSAKLLILLILKDLPGAIIIINKTYNKLSSIRKHIRRRLIHKIHKGTYESKLPIR